MPEPPIVVAARIQHVRDARLLTAQLPNGKVILAHRSKDFAQDLRELPLGSLVLLEMTPYDFEKGRIVGTRLA